MKKALFIIMSLCIAAMWSCTVEIDRTDDGSGNGQTDSTQTDPGTSVDLDSFCEIMNANIASLQAIVEAFEGDDYVASFEETKNSMPEDYVTYSVKFNAGSSAVIWCRKDGNDSKGVPQISAAQDENGKWYWTLDGKWLSIGGSTVPVLEGEDAPRICAKDGRWMISGDAGATWKDLSEMDGQAVSPGKYIFDDVYKKGSFLHLVLDNGETLPISTLQDIDIIFPDADGATCVTGETARIAYEVVGWDEATEVICSCDTPGWEAEIESTGINTGYVVVINTGAEEDAAVTVTAGNSTGDEISKALIFVKGILTAKADVENIGGAGGIVDVEITTNTDYTVSIPSEASGWISVVDDGTKSELRTETVKLAVAGYESGPDRSATVSFTVSGKVVTSIHISQKSQEEEIWGAPIVFADKRVKSILTSTECSPVIDSNKDGEVSYREAAACTELPSFSGSDIESFDELQFFTSLKEIGAETFKGCSELNSIILPNEVTRIGNGAFSGCNNLSSINIPDGVTSIGESAFYGCGSLDSIVLPESLTSISESAFRICSGLVSITLPDGVASIGDYAFSGCSSLSSIELPESLTSIGDYAFSGCSSLSSIELPESLTSIGKCAFSGCSSLSSIELPESWTSIGDEVFYGCSGLVSITLPDGVTSIGKRAFSECSSLSSIELPASLTSIESEAFYKCSSLSSIEWPGSFQSSLSIRGSAFRACSSLVSITFPDGVTSIGQWAFLGCSSLASIVLPASLTNGERAFYGCSGLVSITIPEGVTSIVDEVFYGCSGLVSITIPEGVTSIGDGAFEGCSSLKSIELPASLTSIEYRAFEGCSSLSSIELPESLTSIGGSAFEGCSGLSSITLPDGVTSINQAVFSECSSLSSIELPASLSSIDNNAFYKCSLSSIEFPASLTSIKHNAFSGCSSLTVVKFNSIYPPKLQDASFYRLTIRTVYVPSERYEDYRKILRATDGFKNATILTF